MIVGCYTVDLYCEDERMGQYDCTAWPGQFTGRTETACLKKARANGWKVRKRATSGIDVVCPKHLGRSTAGEGER